MGYSPTKFKLKSKPNRATILGVATLSAAFTHIAADADTLKNKEDGSWVSVKGTVRSPTPELFVLDYANGTVIVETDDWDGSTEGRFFDEGDRVTVYGEVDDAFYQTQTIEAGSVYLHGTETMVTAPASADDENPPPIAPIFSEVLDDYDFQIAGTVSSVADGYFTIDTDAREVIVKIDHLDDLQQPTAGDFVTVSGAPNPTAERGPEIVAETIVWHD